MHSMQAGYLEKAQKYTDKALMQLEKLKSKCHLSGNPKQPQQLQGVLNITACPHPGGPGSGPSSHLPA